MKIFVFVDIATNFIQVSRTEHEHRYALIEELLEMEPSITFEEWDAYITERLEEEIHEHDPGRFLFEVTKLG